MWFENQAPDTCLATRTQSTAVLSDSTSSTNSSEEGWLLAACETLGETCICSAPLAAKLTQPHSVSVLLQFTGKLRTQATMALEPACVGEINCAGHPGNHKPLSGRNKKMPGGLVREKGIFPKGLREQRDLMGGPTRQVFQTWGLEDDKLIFTLRLTVLLPIALSFLLHDKTCKDGRGYLPKHRRRSGGLIFS